MESGENNEDKILLPTHGWPCIAFKPVMTEIMNEGHSVQILDVDENKSLDNNIMLGQFQLLS